MKKTMCIALVLVFLGLSGCNSTKSFTDNSGATKMSASAQVNEMLEALTYQDMDTALGLMHPEKLAYGFDRQTVTAYLQQMMNYVDGQKVNWLEQQSLAVQNSSDESGSIKREKATFEVTLPEARFHLTVEYLHQNENSGFTSFQLVLGVV